MPFGLTASSATRRQCRHGLQVASSAAACARLMVPSAKPSCSCTWSLSARKISASSSSGRLPQPSSSNGCTALCRSSCCGSIACKAQQQGPGSGARILYGSGGGGGELAGANRQGRGFGSRGSASGGFKGRQRPCNSRSRCRKAEGPRSSRPRQSKSQLVKLEEHGRDCACSGSEVAGCGGGMVGAPRHRTTTSVHPLPRCQSSSAQCFTAWMARGEPARGLRPSQQRSRRGPNGGGNNKKARQQNQGAGQAAGCSQWPPCTRKAEKRNVAKLRQYHSAWKGGDGRAALPSC